MNRENFREILKTLAIALVLIVPFLIFRGFPRVDTRFQSSSILEIAFPILFLFAISVIFIGTARLLINLGKIQKRRWFVVAVLGLLLSGFLLFKIVTTARDLMVIKSTNLIAS